METKNVAKKIFLLAVVAALVVAPLLASCGAAQGAMGAAGDVTGGAVGGKCPDVTKPESILAFDFAGTFKLQPDTALKLKAATAAAVDVKGLADQVDADLKAGCGGLAKDLGAPGDFKDGSAACEAALKALNDTKAKIGASAKFTLVVKPPECRASLDAYADCAGKCDAKVSGGKAKVDCEPGKLSGTCDANCEGTCDVSGGAKCDGTCEGTCDADIHGQCGGKCNGKCDGQTSNGASCAGTCDGKCEGNAKAECKGKCGGSCKLKASAKCEGTCTGKCSAEMKAPKCTGEVKPPQMSADCKAHCDANVQAKADCTPASVGFAMSGKGDVEAFNKLKAALEKNLPLILKVAVGMVDTIPKIAANVEAVVQGAQATVTEVAGHASGAAALQAGQLGVCLGDTFKGALGAAGSLKANASVSVKVSASASASGSAGTK